MGEILVPTDIQIFRAQLFSCPTTTQVTVLTELFGVTHMSLFLDCHECLLAAGLE